MPWNYYYYHLRFVNITFNYVIYITFGYLMASLANSYISFVKFLNPPCKPIPTPASVLVVRIGGPVHSVLLRLWLIEQELSFP